MNELITIEPKAYKGIVLSISDYEKYLSIVGEKQALSMKEYFFFDRLLTHDKGIDESIMAVKKLRNEFKEYANSKAYKDFQHDFLSGKYELGL